MLTCQSYQTQHILNAMLKEQLGELTCFLLTKLISLNERFCSLINHTDHLYRDLMDFIPLRVLCVFLFLPMTLKPLCEEELLFVVRFRFLKPTNQPTNKQKQNIL